MSQFECTVKDLEPNNTSVSQGTTQPGEIVSSRGNMSSQENKPTDILSKNDDTASSIFAKIKEEKNIRIILLVLISYLITNSSQFIEMMGNSFPFLIEAGTTSLSGKIVISVIIGLVVVLSTSFFPVP